MDCCNHAVGLTRSMEGRNVSIKRHLSVVVVFAVGAALTGCQSSMGGLAFWNKNQDRSIAHAAPDVNRQQYDGLSKEFASSGRSGSALGGPKPAAPTGISGMWQKSTASVAGVFAAKPKIDTQPDATR